MLRWAVWRAAVGIIAARGQTTLARAVLGGIAIGTCSTLLFVSFLYAVLRRGEVRPLEDGV